MKEKKPTRPCPFAQSGECGVPLKDFVLVKVEAHEKETNLQFEAFAKNRELLVQHITNQILVLRSEIDQRFETLRAEHVGDAKELDRRLEEMNRFRAQLTDERGNYMTRQQYEDKHESLISRVTALEKQSSDLAGRFWMIGAGIALVVSLVVIVADVIMKLWR